MPRNQRERSRGRMPRNQSRNGNDRITVKLTFCEAVTLASGVANTLVFDTIDGILGSLKASYRYYRFEEMTVHVPPPPTQTDTIGSMFLPGLGTVPSQSTTLATLGGPHCRFNPAQSTVSKPFTVDAMGLQGVTDWLFTNGTPSEAALELVGSIISMSDRAASSDELFYEIHVTVSFKELQPIGVIAANLEKLAAKRKGKVPAYSLVVQ